MVDLGSIRALAEIALVTYFTSNIMVSCVFYNPEARERLNAIKRKTQQSYLVAISRLEEEMQSTANDSQRMKEITERTAYLRQLIKEIEPQKYPSKLELLLWGTSFFMSDSLRVTQEDFKAVMMEAALPYLTLPVKIAGNCPACSSTEILYWKTQPRDDEPAEEIYSCAKCKKDLKQQHDTTTQAT